MLDTNFDNVLAINEAITFFHKNGRLPNNPPAGIVVHNTNFLNIDYGYNGTQYGRLQMKRGQFEVVGVTNANGVIQQLDKYNHSGDNTTLQNYRDALKCNDMKYKQTFVSALIILTSECCRSSLITNCIEQLFREDANIPDEAWKGMNFAFTNYKKTCTFEGYKIQAGEEPWTWLTHNDYLRYIGSLNPTKNKIPELQAQINAAYQYSIGNAVAS